MMEHNVELLIKGKSYKGGHYSETFSYAAYSVMEDDELIEDVKGIYKAWNSRCKWNEERTILSITKMEIDKQHRIIFKL